MADFNGDRWEDMLCQWGTTEADGRYLMKSDGTGAFQVSTAGVVGGEPGKVGKPGETAGSGE